MPLNNVDGILHLLQGAVGLTGTAAGGFVSSSARQNQGIALAPDMVRDIITRADLPTSLNAKIALPLANSGAVNAVSASAARLVAVVVDNNDSGVAYVQVFNTASGGVTIGTTVELLDLSVPAGQMGAFLFPHVPSFGTAISWDATTGPHGAVRSTSAKVTALFVYAA